MTTPATKPAKHPNAVKLDASFVPTWTHKLTLATEGYPILQESILAKEFLNDGVLKNYYIQNSGPPIAQGRDKSSRAASLLAKHLRLSGVSLNWVLLSMALREQRIQYMERDVESWNPVLTLRGKGYIVIPDFATLQDPYEVWTRTELEDLGGFLASHIYSGGALVLGGGLAEPNLLNCFGTELSIMIRNSFEIHEVTKGIPCPKA